MLIERIIFPALRKELSNPGILVLLGLRRAGRTTLLRQLEIYSRGKKLKNVHFDLEQPGVGGI